MLRDRQFLRIPRDVVGQHQQTPGHSQFRAEDTRCLQRAYERAHALVHDVAEKVVERNRRLTQGLEGRDRHHEDVRRRQRAKVVAAQFPLEQGTLSAPLAFPQAVQGGLGTISTEDIHLQEALQKA